MTKKLLSVLLSIFVLTAIFTLPASAEEDDSSGSGVQPRFSYISSTKAVCTKLSSGKISFTAIVTCNSLSTPCKASAKLYRRPANSSDSWEALDIYTSTGTGKATVSKSITPTSGYEYKIFASFTAYGDNGAAEATSYYSGIAR